MKNIILKLSVFAIIFSGILSTVSAQSSYLYEGTKFETAVSDLKSDIKALGFRIEETKTVKVKEGKLLP